MKNTRRKIIKRISNPENSKQKLISDLYSLVNKRVIVWIPLKGQDEKDLRFNAKLCGYLRASKNISLSSYGETSNLRLEMEPSCKLGPAFEESFVDFNFENVQDVKVIMFSNKIDTGIIFLN